MHKLMLIIACIGHCTAARISSSNALFDDKYTPSSSFMIHETSSAFR